MPDRRDILTHGESATTWRVTLEQLLRLMTNSVGPPERYAARREWVLRNVPDEEPAYVRILLRNNRAWAATYDGEPEFCWRLLAMVQTSHRGSCSFLFDVFDAELDGLSKPLPRRRHPSVDWGSLLAADDLQ